MAGSVEESSHRVYTVLEAKGERPIRMAQVFPTGLAKVTDLTPKVSSLLSQLILYNAGPCRE
jgi:hypothetical protein